MSVERHGGKRNLKLALFLFAMVLLIFGFTLYKLMHGMHS